MTKMTYFWSLALLSLSACTVDPDAVIREAELTIELRGLSPEAERIELRLVDPSRRDTTLETAVSGETERFIIRTAPAGAFVLEVSEFAGSALMRCTQHPFEGRPNAQLQVDLADGAPCPQSVDGVVDGDVLDAGVADADVVEPDGAALDPDAAVVEPDAAAIDPDAAAIDPDAAVIDPDAAVIDPDAAVIDPDAAVVEPDAAVVEPDAAAIDPDAELEIEPDAEIESDAEGEDGEAEGEEPPGPEGPDA